MTSFDIIVSIRPSLTIENGYKTNGSYFPSLGYAVGSFEMSGMINQAINTQAESYV